MSRRRTVVIGLLGTTLDRGKGPRRWEAWRPSVALSRHPDLVVDRLELLHPRRYLELAETVRDDVQQMSPETTVRLHASEAADPWDFGEVYSGLLDWAQAYPFEVDTEDYLVHITTGTHVAQICL